MLHAANVSIRDERAADIFAREQLLDAAFGPARFTKTCQRLREKQRPARDLALVASAGERLIGTLRFWNVDAGDRPALLLGPLAVAETHRSEGIGSRLIRAGLARARRLGHRAVLLVGDAPYYERFGFERRFKDGLIMPGPVEADRFLGLELVSGSLAGARGRVLPAVDVTALRLTQRAA
ncbi:MAG: N-acetyltransferase [Methylobacteriaceae bacterium]|nr:N-acetyltransferase [Methylobacteriaceae bacterium]